MSEPIKSADDIRAARAAGNILITEAIREDRAYDAKGIRLLRWWIADLRERKTIIRNKPVKLPELMKNYLNTVLLFTIGELVLITDHDEVKIVLSSRRERPVLTGVTLLEATATTTTPAEPVTAA